MNRQALFTGLVILSIFLAGALSGAAVVQVFSGPEVASGAEAATDGPVERGEGTRPDRRDRPDDRRPGPFAFARFLEEELDLTEDQRDQVLAILERREEEARQMFRQSRARFQDHLEETLDEVESALPSEQAEEFRLLMEEMERRFRRDE
ncbi:MAG: hypothetical protein R3223_03175 [Longimicrobiales bacterium]|nr:hypothetical protein [Longimicrobiales bacterium]